MGLQESAGGHVDNLVVTAQQAGPIPLNASFRCAPGELLALVGPSGSGKTTLLRTIAGLYQPQQGRVSCAGREWFLAQSGQRHSLPPQARQIGMVFQDYALFPHLTALQNVQLAMGHLPRAQRFEQAAQWLSKVRLQGLEARYPSELSGGQRQRVALARALAREPQVLLLDEPFSAVDQVTRRRLQRELALLRQQISIPIILVTHDLEEATALADQICVLHNGVSLQQGTPEALFRKPTSPLVARLLDRHNVFSGEVVETEAGRRLQWGEWWLEVAEGLAAGMVPAAVRYRAASSGAAFPRRTRKPSGGNGQRNGGVGRHDINLAACFPRRYATFRHRHPRGQT